MQSSAITGLAPAAGGADGTGKLADGFDQFLSLLTTQLQNQDPLSPLDTHEFTRQLVQFANVEQAIATNSKLDHLIDLQSGGKAADAVAYIGRSVAAEADRVMLQNGQATLTYDLARQAEEVRIVLFDQQGDPVRTIRGETGAGPHTFVWDGTANDGSALPDAVYDVAIAAVDSDDSAVSTTTGTIGEVTGIEMADGTVVLDVGELEVPLGNVTAVR